MSATADAPLQRSLSVRVMLASAVLALCVAGIFVVLLLTASSLRDASDREAHSKDVTVAALTLEKLTVDIQSGVRGFALTGRERFLDPWRQARAELPEAIAAFERLVAGDSAQSRRARALTGEIRAYVDDYSVPLVSIARQSPAAARSSVATGEGTRRFDSISRRFARVLAAEDARTASSAASARRDTSLAIGLGFGGLFLATLLILFFGVYLARSIARPIREVARGAGRLADGDLSIRLGQRGPGEVGELTAAFNAMAGSLERSRAELEAQNELLRESERLKAELVSMVSHELRTPLASVRGFTSLLLKRDIDDAARRRYLQIVDAQARRLSALLDDFLDVERIEERGLELRHELVDMAAILREQAQLFGAEDPRHDIRLDLPDEPLLVRGDPDRLSQVVGNLFSNAIKYSPEGGAVEGSAERRGGEVRFSVEDEGMGIPPAQQARIFTKFFRGGAAASGISGTGLGLAVAREIVEAHGGKIGFTSAVDEGSTFWVELPAAEDPLSGSAAVGERDATTERR